MANKVYLGTVRINGVIKAPGFSYGAEASSKDISPIIDIGDSVSDDYDIQWVVENGKLLAADPVMFGISYDDLLYQGFVEKRPVRIDGQAYFIRLVKDFGEWKEFGANDPAAYSSNGTSSFLQGPTVEADSRCTVAFGLPGGGDVNSNFKSGSRARTVGWRPVLESVGIFFSSFEQGQKVELWGGQSVVAGILKEITDYDLVLRDVHFGGLTDQDLGSLARLLPYGQLSVDRAAIAGIHVRGGQING